MKGLMYIIIAGVCLFGMYKCTKSPSTSVNVQALMSTNSNGFTTIPDKIKIFDTNRVVIFAPVNCPSATAKKADYLANELERLKIPYTRTSRFSVDADPRKITKEEWEAFNDRLNTLFKQPGPKVFIKGKFKADPTLTEVIVEYER